MALHESASLFRLACEAVQRLPANAPAAVTVGIAIEDGDVSTALELSEWLAGEYGLRRSVRLQHQAIAVRFSRPAASVASAALP